MTTAISTLENPNTLAESYTPQTLPLGTYVNDALTIFARSKDTARAYRTSVGLFLEYVSERMDTTTPLASTIQEGRRVLWEYRGNTNVFSHLTASIVDGFLTYRQQVGDSTNSANSRYAAIKSFLGVAYRDGYITHQQAASMNVKAYKLRVKQDQKPVGRRLKPSEVKQLKCCIDMTTVKGARDRAIIDCALYAGLRRAEIANLDVESMKEDTGIKVLLVKGKGQKSRKIPIAKPLIRSIKHWLAVSGKTSGALFEGLTKGGNLTGKRIYGDTVAAIVAQYGFDSGISEEKGDNRLSAHDLRRTAARNAYDNGAPLLLIQQMLGHADPKTTSKYIGVSESVTESAVDFIRY